MAHDILIRAGKAAMFYVGEPPWHHLGTPLTGPATAAQALEVAGLNWDVLKVPLYAVADARLQQVKGKYVLVPQDRWGDQDCPIFGSVGESYRVLQNREAFTFFDPIVGPDAAIYHTAGALGQGERVWLLARLPRTFEVAPGDSVEPYMLLSNSHDGKAAVQLKFTPIRVVCQNTLNAALRNGPTLRIPHRRDLNTRLELARQQLGLYSYRVEQPSDADAAEEQAQNLHALLEAGFTQLAEQFSRMAELKLDGAAAENYFRAVFPEPKSHDAERARRAEEGRALAHYFYRHGQGNGEDAIKGSLWAAYNGVAEYVDHRGGARAQRLVSPERHLQSLWFGTGASTKTRALNHALTLLDAVGSNAGASVMVS